MSELTQKKFSIIVPVYNVDKYIKETIESFLSQDIPENEYEIICVNDGSTDDSEKVINSLKSLHENIILYTQENAGVSVARNKGIELARGEYIWFMDGDDLILPNCLGNIYRIMKETNGDSFLFRCNHFTTTPKYETAQWKYEYCNDYDKILEFMEYNGGAGVCGNVYKTSFLKENNLLFKQGIHYSEDVYYNFTVLLKMRCGVKTDEIYYIKRDREDSVIHTTYNKLFKHASSMSNLIDEYKILYEKEQDSARKELCNDKIFLAEKALLFDMMRAGDLKKAKEQVCTLKAKKLYPYPIKLSLLKGNRTFRDFGINLLSVLFPFEPYFYFIVFVFSVIRKFRG